ncbi:MAG: short-chain dehydrogenase [Coxiella sp. (in: Bacteria)]|nr:MAG: short-chain dehydrogenase [Coxiella sp. (in: g-proteobacteria)]
MQIDLSNKVALVTGASQGIGFSIAKMLAQQGCHLIITSSNQQLLQQAEQAIAAHSKGKVTAIVGDVMDADTPARIVQVALEQYGRIDILVNNVGGTGRVVGFEESTRDDWMDGFQLNVMSAVGFTQAVLPAMKAQQWGRLIFLSSEVAVKPGMIMAHYCTTKAAISCLTKELANEMGQFNITVNSVAPGVIPTPSWDGGAEAMGVTREEFAATYCQNIMGEGALGHVDDVAAQVCFLCSDHARWITGANHRVDGGSVPFVQN